MHRAATSLAALLAACAPEAEPCAGGPLTPLAGGAAPHFELEDVNATSPTYGQLVAPSQHLDRVSAWYFGHAT